MEFRSAPCPPHHASDGLLLPLLTLHWHAVISLAWARRLPPAPHATESGDGPLQALCLAKSSRWSLGKVFIRSPLSVMA